MRKEPAVAERAFRYKDSLRLNLLATLDDVDPELLEMYRKLGISVDEQKKLQNVAVDIVVDSVSVATTFQKTLAEKGIIFMPISEARTGFQETQKEKVVFIILSPSVVSVRIMLKYLGHR